MWCMKKVNSKFTCKMNRNGSMRGQAFGNYCFCRCHINRKKSKRCSWSKEMAQETKMPSAGLPSFLHGFSGDNISLQVLKSSNRILIDYLSE